MEEKSFFYLDFQEGKRVEVRGIRGVFIEMFRSMPNYELEFHVVYICKIM